MFTAYGADRSGSAAIEAALEIAGFAYQRIEAATWIGGPTYDALRAVNPLGQVPVLQSDDGRVMTESAAILIHLGLAFPESGLLPRDAARRAQAIRGLVFIAANCYSAIGVIDYPQRWLPDGDEAELKRVQAGARQRLHLMWEQFADAFAADPFLSGESIGALDLLAAVVSRWSGARAHLAAARPAWAPVFGRIEAVPAVARVFARHWPACT